LRDPNGIGAEAQAAAPVTDIQFAGDTLLLHVLIHQKLNVARTKELRPQVLEHSAAAAFDFLHDASVLSKTIVLSPLPPLSALFGGGGLGPARLSLGGAGAPGGFGLL